MGPVDPTDQATSTADGTSSEPTSSATTTEGPLDTSGEEGSSTGATDQSCADGCMSPPSECFLPVGRCVDDACQYTPAASSTDCDDADECTTVDHCDGAGNCVGGDTIPCERPNAEGGTCVAGACGGWTCIDPYENCDMDWSNGCEIPTGVPNSCNANGLGEVNVCGTAYCGTEIGPNTINFMEENYRCVTCSNCQSPADGSVAWCNHSTGGWFTPEAGECPAFYEGSTCEP